MKLLSILAKGTTVLTLTFATQALSGEDIEAESAVDNSEVINQTDDSEIFELAEFSVTGNSLYTNQITALKTPTAIIDIPQSLSIVDSDEIVLRGFTSIGDIIDYTPGLSSSQGEGHRESPYGKDY